MKTFQVTLAQCPPQAEAVVVIDVCRAFSTAAYALEGGAERIILVSTPDEAFRLKEQNPGWLLAGEENGLPIDGFDLWNSPVDIEKSDLKSKTLVLRTSSGTQGVIRCKDVKLLFAASFVVADSTAADLKAADPGSIAFVITGVRQDVSGIEDIACADYMQDLLTTKSISKQFYLDKSRDCNPHRIAETPSLFERFKKDVEMCLTENQFDFSMRVQKQDGLLVLEKS